MKLNSAFTRVSRKATAYIDYKEMTIKKGTTVHSTTIPAGSAVAKLEDSEFDTENKQDLHF